MANSKILKNVERWKWRLDCGEGISGESVPDSWVHIDNGVVIAVGTGEVPDIAVPCIDGGGKLLLPGLIDSHIHVAGLGESTYFVQLDGCKSIADLQTRIQQHRAENPSLSWIQGTHWDQSDIGGYPSRFDLDAISGCSDVPMLLWRACWHIAVLNTKAMQLCGLLDASGELCAHFKQPEGGVVDVIEENGRMKATGILRERAVEGAVAAMGSKSHDERKQFIRDGLKACLDCGLTAVQTNDEGCYRVYQEMNAEEGGDRLPMRVFLTPTEKELGDESLNMIKFEGKAHDLQAATARLSAERVKIFSDGSLGAETAAIRTTANAPVGFTTTSSSSSTKEEMPSSASASSSASFNGVLIHSLDSLVEQISRARSRGWRVEIHAIGDASAEQVLSAMEIAYGADGDEEEMGTWLPVLTHCQVLGWDLMTRMARGKVIANVQPSFVPTDMRWVLERLSKAHLECSYAWKTLMIQGIVVAGGSDAPIETPNPFTGMHDAIYRVSREADRSVFREEECLSFAEALYCYTINAAKCAGDKAASCFGQVEPGFAADLVLVDPAVLSDHRLLLSLTPTLVIIGGHVEVDRVSHPSPQDTGKQPSGPFIPGKGGRMKRGWLQCDCCRVRI